MVETVVAGSIKPREDETTHMVMLNREIEIDGDDYTGMIDEPSMCPQCKHAIKPETIGIFTFSNEEGNHFLSISYLCRSCYRSFITLHSLELKERDGTFRSKCLYIEPNRASERVFESRITEISPDFIRIYNQALAAEAYSLTEICGMAYRKALEFLVKDYLISKEPDKADAIGKMELGNCIANKTSDNVKLVASRCAWLGNDHTHYVVKFDDKDLDDLKRLLEATVYWIMIELITQDATEIQRR